MLSQLFRNSSQSVWVLADTRAGTANQALGVAEALGMPFQVISLKKKTFYESFASIAPSISSHLLPTSHTMTLRPPWPHIIIAAGRRAALVARWIRISALKTSLSTPFLVQIMFPGWQRLADFNLVAIPNHDRLLQTPDNVLHITGAPHRLTPRRLLKAAEQWKNRFYSLPKPRIVCLVGGASGRWRPLTADIARTLAKQTANLATIHGGSVLVTTSRRTGRAATAALFSELTDAGVPLFIHYWRESAENPYTALLALADSVVVTGDSVSMCTEACAQPGPVFIFSPPGWAKAKHARLHAELFSLGYARPLPYGDERIFSYWRHPPLNPARTVAAQIRMRWDFACLKSINREKE